MRYEQLSVGRLRVDNIEGSGAPIDLGKGQKWYMDGTNGSNGNSGLSANTPLKTIATAESAMTTGQNDTLIFLPGTETITSLLTWNLSNTHLVGSHSATPWSNNCKIQHTASATLSPCILNSGSDNLFANMHFIWGSVGAANHNFLHNSGSGNHYENCWFEGPTNATQGTDTEASTVKVGGGGNYFKNCIFGTTAHGTMNGAAQVSFALPYRTTFENCMFYMRPAATTGRFLYCGTSQISGPQFFKSCMFVSHWVNAGDQIAQILAGAASALDGGMLIFDPNCIFVGADAVAVDGATQFTYVGHPLTAAHVGANAGIILRVSGANP